VTLTLTRYPTAPTVPCAAAETGRIAHDHMVEIDGVLVQWMSVESLAIAVRTAGREIAVRAADALCRKELGDGLATVVGEFIVDGPAPMVVVGVHEGLPLWQTAAAGDEHALSVCVVRPDENAQHHEGDAQYDGAEQ
jgi:hypothetical protein